MYSVRQYRYQLKKWNIAKNLTSAAKEKTIQVLGKRARDGAETGEVRYNGVEVDKKRLRRYLQSSARQQPELRLSGIVYVNTKSFHHALTDGLFSQIRSLESTLRGSAKPFPIPNRRRDTKRSQCLQPPDEQPNAKKRAIAWQCTVSNNGGYRRKNTQSKSETPFGRPIARPLHRHVGR